MPEQPNKILIVDDEEDLLTALQTGLEGAGYTVVVCARGDRVIELVGRERPNLILLDLNLPGMHGEAVLKALQSDPAARQIPVIVITAQQEIQRLTQTFEGGAVSFYPKPLQMEVLGSLIRTVLATRRRA